jgi:hypothetical protein
VACFLLKNIFERFLEGLVSIDRGADIGNDAFQPVAGHFNTAGNHSVSHL